MTPSAFKTTNNVKCRFEDIMMSKCLGIAAYSLSGLVQSHPLPLPLSPPRLPRVATSGTP